MIVIPCVIASFIAGAFFSWFMSTAPTEND